MYMYTNCFVCDNFCFVGMGMELCQLDHQENYEYIYEILFFGGGVHQSIRDRTAQAGAPIFEMLCIYMTKWKGFYEEFNYVQNFVFLGGGSSLLETGLHRLAPPFLKCSAFI